MTTITFGTVVRSYDDFWRLHNPDSPAVIDVKTGDQWWFHHGKKHRLNGPAVISKHSQEWWIMGCKHRENGPAVVSTVPGRKQEVQFWLHGEEMELSEYHRIMCKRSKNKYVPKNTSNFCSSNFCSLLTILVAEIAWYMIFVLTVVGVLKCLGL